MSLFCVDRPNYSKRLHYIIRHSLLALKDFAILLMLQQETCANSLCFLHMSPLRRPVPLQSYCRVTDIKFWWWIEVVEEEESERGGEGGGGGGGE